jgi:hypothetical protein
MAQMIPRYNEYSEREHLQREINQLKNELSVLKKDMEKFKDFMNTNASFTDFKRFKMVEEEEKFTLTLRRADFPSYNGRNNPFEELPF